MMSSHHRRSTTCSPSRGKSGDKGLDKNTHGHRLVRGMPRPDLLLAPPSAPSYPGGGRTGRDVREGCDRRTARARIEPEVGLSTKRLRRYVCLPQSRWKFYRASFNLSHRIHKDCCPRVPLSLVRLSNASFLAHMLFVRGSQPIRTRPRKCTSLLSSREDYICASAYGMEMLEKHRSLGWDTDIVTLGAKWFRAGKCFSRTIRRHEHSWVRR